MKEFWVRKYEYQPKVHFALDIECTPIKGEENTFIRVIEYSAYEHMLALAQVLTPSDSKVAVAWEKMVNKIQVLESSLEQAIEERDEARYICTLQKIPTMENHLRIKEENERLKAEIKKLKEEIPVFENKMTKGFPFQGI